MKKHLASLILLGVICTVNYPSDCFIVDTKFNSDQEHYKAQVQCSYRDIKGVELNRSLYFAKIGKGQAAGKTSRVDYIPSDDLTDSITLSCE